MLTRFKNRKPIRTNYIQLDTSKCKACWKCIEECPNQVIDKINILWHKHARIGYAMNCTGCFKCLKVCEFNALARI